MLWGFVGCGHLVQAIIQGALSEKVLKRSATFATNRSQAKLKAFCRRSGVKALKSNCELVQKAQIIVLGTKPQDISKVLAEIAPFVTQKHTVVSLAAGVPTDVLRKHFPEAAGIVRVMANTPALIQKGVFGIYFRKSNSKIKREVLRLFGSLGTAILLKNDREVDAMTSASASGTGFVFLFMEQFALWLRKKGFKPAVARAVVVETFIGSSTLARSTPEKPFEDLRAAVTSKRGTTLAGVNKMRSKEVGTGLQSGLEASFLRAQELSKSLRKR